MPSSVHSSDQFFGPNLMFFLIGGFLAGLIVPHENGFAISLVERIEALVMIIFLPLVCFSVNRRPLN